MKIRGAGARCSDGRCPIRHPRQNRLLQAKPGRTLSRLIVPFKVVPASSLPSPRKARAKHLRVCLTVLAFFGARLGFGQVIGWQDEIGHPFRNSTHLNYNEVASGVATFPNNFVIATTGYAYETLVPTNNVHNQIFLRYYDYDGTLLNEDTIGGMVAGGYLARITDSTFLVNVEYDYIRLGQTIFDTGQNGGYLLREYTSSGRMLWQRRMRADTKSRSSHFFPRTNGGFAIDAWINMDNHGVDSLAFEFYQAGGLLERVVDFPNIDATGFFGYTKSPERYFVNRAQQRGNPSPWLYTVVQLDSVLNVRREDTIGFLAHYYGNEQIIVKPGGGYISLLPQPTDTLRSKLSFFDRPGQPSSSLLFDSGSISLVPLADGGALTFESKLVSNSWRVLDSLYQRGRNTLVSLTFKRRDASWQPIWSVDISDWNNDSVMYSYTPVTSVPSSPNDALFYGSRVVQSSVHSEPWGTFALIGRINGVGQIFDPTAVKGPRERMSGLKATLYPNPASDRVFIDSEKMLDYRILTVTGEAVGQGSISSTRPASLQSLPPGLYQLVFIRWRPHDAQALHKAIAQLPSPAPFPAQASARKAMPKKDGTNPRLPISKFLSCLNPRCGQSNLSYPSPQNDTRLS